MPVATTTSKVQYTQQVGGSVTEWSFAFVTYDEEDLTVYKTTPLGVDTLLVLDSDYTVSLNADQSASPGGTVTIDPAIGEGYVVTIARIVALTQETQLVRGGAWDPAVIERRLDLMVMMTQQNKEEIDRKAGVSITDDIGGDLITIAQEAAEDALAAQAGAEAAQTAAEAAQTAAESAQSGAEAAQAAAEAVAATLSFPEIDAGDAGLGIVVNGAGDGYELGGDAASYSIGSNAGDLVLLASGGKFDVNRLPVGTGANQIVQLDGSGRLPAVDASQLTGLSTTMFHSWATRPSTADSTWVSVAWSPSLHRFVAVSSGGVAASSEDGHSWTARTIGAYTWQDVVWAAELGLFVAVASAGANQVATSPDGITWTNRTAASTNQWYSVTWSPELNLLAAVALTGTGNRVMTSPDGITWTSRTSAADISWVSITWSPDLTLFAACAITGGPDSIMTSPDGITWTSRTSASASAYRSIAWSSAFSKFVCLGGTTVAQYSSNGIDWSAGEILNGNGTWPDVIAIDELGMAVGSSPDATNGRNACVTEDGITWYVRYHTGTSIYSIAWSSALKLIAGAGQAGTGTRMSVGY